MVAVTLAGVIGPALLLTACVRRWIAAVPWRIVILLLSLTLGFLHGAVFTSKLPVPVDEVARGYPYRGIFGDVQPRNPLTNDTVKLFLPWMQVAREELFHLRAPLWNRYSFSGYPLLGNGESAPFSPFFLMTLIVPLPKQIVAMAGLKLFVSLLFSYLFVKRYGASDAAACFAASTYTFSIGSTVNLYYSSGTVMSLLPATLFSLLFAIDEPSRKGRVLVALVVASLMAGGHPESVLHIAMGAAMVLAIELALAGDRRDWMRRFRLPLWGAIAGVGLSAPAWILSALQVPLSARYASLHAGPHSDTYRLTVLWALVSPNGFGNPARHNWNWISNYFSIASSYVGLLPLVLAIAIIVAKSARARERAWIVSAVIIFLIAMNWSFAGRVFRALPLLDVTAHDKFRFVACFLVAAAAALWVDRRPSRFVIAPFALLVAGLAIYVWRLRPGVETPVDLIGAATVLLFCLVPGRSFAFAAVALTTIELFALNAGFNALVDARYYKPELPIMLALRERAPAEPFRIVGYDWTFLPNASAQYGVEDIRGSDPMAFAWYVELLRPIALENTQFDVLRVGDVDHELIDFLNVRFLLAEPGESFGAKWKMVYDGRDGRLFENANARARFTVDGGSVNTRRVGSTFFLDVKTAKPAFVESSEPSEGRRVFVDDVAGRIEPVRGHFVGFHVPPGEHRVKLIYRPLSFDFALFISFLSIVVLIFPKTGNRTLGGVVVTGPKRGE